MKVVVLFLYFVISCLNDEVLVLPTNPIDVDSYAAALQIMESIKSSGKSLCFIAGATADSTELGEIKLAISKIMGKSIDDASVVSTTDEFLAKYYTARTDKEKFYDPIYQHFLDVDCQPGQSADNMLTQEVITQFTQKETSLSTLKLNSAQVMVIACEIVQIYTVQSLYMTSPTRGKERKITEMIYYNEQTIDIMRGITDKRARDNEYISKIENFIKEISKLQTLPHVHIIKCLLKKTESSYATTQLTSVGIMYKMMLGKFLKSETCDTSTLSRERRDVITGIFTGTSPVNLELVEREAALIALKKLYDSLYEVNIFGYFGLLKHLDTYLNFKDSTFDSTKFDADYDLTTDNILISQFGGNALTKEYEVVAVYCVIADIRHKPRDILDAELKARYSKIIDAFAFFLRTFQTDTEEAFIREFFVHLNHVRRDSKLIDDYTKKSFHNVLQYRCMLGSGSVAFNQRFKPHLEIIERFINLEYATMHCQSGVWNRQDFVTGLSLRLLGVHDENLITFTFIYEFVIRMLAQKSDSIQVMWTDVAYLDEKGECYGKKNIDYSKLTFPPNSQPTTDLDSFDKSIVSRCSTVRSVAEAVKNIRPISVSDKALLLLAIIHLSNDLSQFNLLPEDEKIKLVKKNIGDLPQAPKDGLAGALMLNCEIQRAIAFGKYYEYPLFISMYSMVVVTYFNETSCGYLPNTFNSDNLGNLANLLIKHPVLVSYTVSEILNPLIPRFKIISQSYYSSLSGTLIDLRFSKRFVNNHTCSFIDSDDSKLREMIKSYLIEMNLTENLFPYKHSDIARVFSCHLLREVISTRDKLDNRRNLSSRDLNALNEMLTTVINKFPHLKEKTTPNFEHVLRNVTLNEKFNKYFDSPIKVSLSECELRMIYFRKDTTITTTTTTSNAGSTVSTSEGKNKLSPGAVAGIVIGTICGLCLLIGIVIYFVRSKRSH